jgi:murein DD-endopeptidase MepM/ murein hydrolase activator NlpD
MKRILRLALSAVAVILLVLAYFIWRRMGNSGRTAQVTEFLRQPDAHADWMVTAKQRCNDAPFLLPSDGFIGFLWDDSFRPGHRHQGIDIFGGKDPGLTPIFSVYDGYLTRLPDWKSTVIIRIPQDPFNPDRQIWTYYTHMATPSGSSFVSDQFPPGTEGEFVRAGTFLGYQGNYSGDANNPVGVHLHFSIVKDDGNGTYLNELNIDNTIDPSLYFGLNLNGPNNLGEIPVCLPESS